MPMPDVVPPPNDGASWGDWVYRQEADLLVYLPYSDDGYEVPLGELREAAGLLTWVADLIAKGWLPPGGLGEFLLAVDALVGLRKLVVRRPPA